MSDNNWKTYPAANQIKQETNPAVEIYGLRFHGDQTLYEYLIEFLLVFASAKNADHTGKMDFHSYDPLQKTEYYVEPREGFRRFIFYAQAMKGRVQADEVAYREIITVLKKHIQGNNEKKKEEFLFAVQELFRGYAAVLKKRTWCAQELLPMCPEMILCEQMPNDTFRKKGPQDTWEKKCGVEVLRGSFDRDATFYDASFELTKHNFLARGGDMYYLHLLQAMQNQDDTRERLRLALTNLLTSKSEQFTELANWIQNTWVREKNIDPECLYRRMQMGYLPAGSYEWSGHYAVKELLNFLSNELHPVKRVELLAKGTMFQILRMLLDRTSEYLGAEPFPVIVDMRSRKGGTIIRQLSVESLNQISDAFVSAINQCVVKRRGAAEPDKEAEYSAFIKAKKESLDVFRAKGKELQFIIPMKGPYERFSLSEDLLRFLVLSLVRPGTSMDLNHFLESLYKHYRIVIGPNEYVKSVQDNSTDKGYVNSFSYNLDAFQRFLKAAGFLRDLSDATSIVVNPYEEVLLG